MMQNEGSIDFGLRNNTGASNDSPDYMNMMDIDESSQGSSSQQPHANIVPQPSTINKKMKRQESNPVPSVSRAGKAQFEEEEKEPLKPRTYLDRCKEVGRIGALKAQLDFESCCGNVKKFDEDGLDIEALS